MIDPENGTIFSVTKSILTEPDNHIFRIGNRIVSRRQYFEHVVSELDEFDTRIEYAYSDLAADITRKTTIDKSMTEVYARIANDLDSEYFRTGFKPFATKASNIRYLREKFPNKLINLDEVGTPEEMISFLEGNESLAIKVADLKQGATSNVKYGIRISPDSEYDVVAIRESRARNGEPSYVVSRAEPRIKDIDKFKSSKIVGQNEAENIVSEMIEVSSKDVTSELKFSTNEVTMVALGGAAVGVALVYTTAAIAQSIGDPNWTVDHINKSFIDMYRWTTKWMLSDSGQITTNYINDAASANGSTMLTQTAAYAAGGITGDLNEGIETANNLNGNYIMNGISAAFYQKYGTKAGIASSVVVGVTLFPVEAGLAPLAGLAYGSAYLVSLAAHGDSRYADEMAYTIISGVTTAMSEVIDFFDGDDHQEPINGERIRIYLSSYVPYTSNYYRTSVICPDNNVWSQLSPFDYNDIHFKGLNLSFDTKFDSLYSKYWRSVETCNQYTEKIQNPEKTYGIFDVLNAWGPNSPDGYRSVMVQLDRLTYGNNPSDFKKHPNTSLRLTVPFSGPTEDGHYLPFWTKQVRTDGDGSKADFNNDYVIASPYMDKTPITYENGNIVVNGYTSNAHSLSMNRFVLPIESSLVFSNNQIIEPRESSVRSNTNWQNLPLNIVAVNSLKYQNKFETIEGNLRAKFSNVTAHVYTQSSPGTTLAILKNTEDDKYVIDTKYAAKLSKSGIHCNSLSQVCFSDFATDVEDKPVVFSVLTSGLFNSSSKYLRDIDTLKEGMLTGGMAYARFIVEDPNSQKHSSSDEVDAYRVTIPLYWDNKKPYIFVKDGSIGNLSIQHVVYNKTQHEWKLDTLPQARNDLTKFSMSYDGKNGILVLNLVDTTNGYLPPSLTQLERGVNCDEHTAHMDENGTYSIECVGSLAKQPSTDKSKLNLDTKSILSSLMVYQKESTSKYYNKQADIWLNGQKLFPEAKLMSYYDYYTKTQKSVLSLNGYSEVEARQWGGIPIGDYLNSCTSSSISSFMEGDKTYRDLITVCTLSNGTHRAVALDYFNECGNTGFVSWDSKANRLYCANKNLLPVSSPIVPLLDTTSVAYCGSIDSEYWYTTGKVKVMCSWNSDRGFHQDTAELDYMNKCLPGDLVHYNKGSSSTPGTLSCYSN